MKISLTDFSQRADTLSILKITKGHYSIKKEESLTVIPIRTSHDDALLLFKVS